MQHERISKFADALGVTGAFALGSIAITVALALVFRFSESQYSAITLSEWLAYAGRLLTYALFFGFTVDAIRFVASFLWPRFSHFAPSLADLVNIELSRHPELHERRS